MKVIKRFRDKETRKIYNVGETYDGTKARAKEIADKGFIEESEGSEEGNEDNSGSTNETAASLDVENILNSNIESIKEKVDEVDKELLSVILETEKGNQNRKGVIEHIESLLESE